MKTDSRNKLWITLTIACLTVLGLVVTAFRAQADQWDKKTIMTVNQPIQVTDKLLEPGTYVFKLESSPSDRHIVQIFNADQSHIIDTVLAIPNYRLQPTGKSQFLFYETPPGTAKALRAWFYPGDNFGQEFRYPKELKQLALLEPPPAPVAPPAPPAAATETPAEVTPAPAPAPEAATQEPQETAQNNPPPAPEPAPEPQPAPSTESLPKTASPYPLIGLAGLFSIGAFGLLRLLRGERS